MKSDILSPKALFQKNVRYLIPLFQRPYVWSQDDQWEPLWDDVRNTAERYIEELERLGDDRGADAERETPAHFLGAVVLQQQPTATIDIEQRQVIDGQQRLTTLQILLNAAQKVCHDVGLEAGARRLRKLVVNDEDFVTDEPDHVFKIWPTNVDQVQFRKAMRDGFSADDDDKDSPVVLAHEFFQLQIKEWLTRGPDAVERRASALETTLTGLLQMVVIDLETKDDAHVIFETLNARGTPLIESDLIKNYILYQAQEAGQDERNIYNNYWNALEDDWWRKSVRQGRIVRPRLDVFLNYWLSMRTVVDVPASKVFEGFRRYTRSKNIEEIAADITKVGATYSSLQCVTDPVESTFMYRWRVMDAGVVTPLLLLLFSASNDQLPGARRARALQALESFLVRRMVCRVTTKDYNRLILDLAENLQKRGIEFADDIIVEFLSQQTADARQWPDDRKLHDAFLGLPLYRLLTRGRLRLVLEGIETALRTSRTEQPDCPRDLTIEHIMPQGWQKHWPLTTGDTDSEVATSERTRLVHTIGNLSLVNERLNPSLSNGPWPLKRKALGDHSVLFLNKHLLETSSPDCWDEGAI